jgi:hypothetical protein
LRTGQGSSHPDRETEAAKLRRLPDDICHWLRNRPLDHKSTMQENTSRQIVPLRHSEQKG